MPDYNIQGGLPWAGAGGQANMFAGLGGSPQQAEASLGPSYANAYSSALAMNSQNYSNILGGYQKTLANQTSAEDAIGRGYTDLSNQVVGGLQGANQANQQLINNAYTKQAGGALQGLINSGLGNSTVLSSVQRGIGLDQQLALTNSNNQFANTIAGYQSNLGQAGLQYGNQALMQNTGEANQQLGWMNSVQAQYPNAQAYGQLAQQYGQWDQMNQDRALAQRGLTTGGPGTAGGYQPTGGGFPPSAISWGQNGVQDAGGYGTPAWNAYGASNPAGAAAGYGGDIPQYTALGSSMGPALGQPDYSGAGPQSEATGYPTATTPQQQATGYPGSPYGSPYGDQSYPTDPYANTAASAYGAALGGAALGGPDFTYSGE